MLGMECNRDEAIRAKKLAERKLTEKDVIGAKRLALKAESLFPGLEGLSQFQEILDVYVAFEKKVNGEVDWYGIIGVDPLADDDTIRKKYRKLALSLHPDKNKCVGADGAFKILSQAWSFLSDKAKRAAYNHHQNIRTSTSKRQGSNPQAGSVKNGSKGVRNSSSRYPGTQENAKSDSGPCSSNPGTFWTSCRRCNMQYEYLIMYRNQKLLCPYCHLPFLAKEVPPPPSANISYPPSTCWPFNQWQQESGKRSNSTNYLKRKFPPTKRMRTSGLSSVSSTKELHIPRASSSMVGGASSLSMPNGATGPPMVGSFNKVAKDLFTCEVNGEVLGKKSSGNYSECNGTKSAKDFSPSDFLMEKAKVDILKMLKGCSMTASLRSSSTKGDRTAEEKEIMQDIAEESDITSRKKAGNETRAVVEGTLVQSRISPFYLSRNDELSESISCPFTAPSTGSIIKTTEIMTMAVPNPEFCDFDTDRSEESFGENQVWALYDANDGMPRYYALIHGMISKDPLEVQIRWLNLKNNSELSPLYWINCSFPRTTGDFRVGKYEVIKNCISFSHQIKWRKDTGGIIQIFPKKGDVWALYRNWSADWNELTADDVIRQYDVVEVLEDFNEVQGVPVIPLVKVAGFKAVFHQHLDSRTIYTIPKGEMLRFSHQIPAHSISGDEAQKGLNGCVELDPAAMPMEFLQVVGEAEEEATERKVKFGDVEVLAEVSNDGISCANANYILIETD